MSDAASFVMKVNSTDNNEHIFSWIKLGDGDEKEKEDVRYRLTYKPAKEVSSWGLDFEPMPKVKSTIVRLPSAEQDRLKFLFGWEDLIRCLNHAPGQGDTGDSDNNIRTFANKWIAKPLDLSPFYIATNGTKTGFGRRFLLQHGFVVHEQ
jgi:hypothetical protein